MTAIALDHINIVAPAALLAQVRDFYCQLLARGRLFAAPAIGYTLMARPCCTSPKILARVAPPATSIMWLLPASI